MTSQSQALRHQGQQKRQHGQCLAMAAVTNFYVRQSWLQRQRRLAVLGDKVELGDMLATLRCFLRPGRLIRQCRPTTLATPVTTGPFVQGVAALWTRHRRNSLDIPWI